MPKMPLQGEHALPIAERQSRPRDRRPADRRSRPQRWSDAVAELIALQAEYAAWSAALPESMRDTATAEIFRRSSISTSMPSPISNRRGVTVATDPQQSGEF